MESIFKISQEKATTLPTFEFIKLDSSYLNNQDSIRINDKIKRKNYWNLQQVSYRGGHLLPFTRKIKINMEFWAKNESISPRIPSYGAISLRQAHSFNKISKSVGFLEALHISLKFSRFICREVLETINLALKNLLKINILFLDLTNARNIDVIAFEKLFKSVKLLKLNHLALRTSAATDVGLKFNFTAPKNLISIKKLGLTFNSIHSLELFDEPFSKLFLDKLKLTYLKFQFQVNCKNFEVYLIKISTLLERNQAIKVLKFDFKYTNSKFDDKQLEMMSHALEKLILLTDLFLNFKGFDCNISDKGIEYISHAIESMSELKKLSLYFYSKSSELTDRGLKFLVESVEKSDNLKKIDIVLTENWRIKNQDTS